MAKMGTCSGDTDLLDVSSALFYHIDRKRAGIKAGQPSTMRGMDIGILTALRMEGWPLLRRKGWTMRRSSSGRCIYERVEGGIRIRWIVTGMGAARAMEGLEEILEDLSPRALLSVGFAGGLHSELGVGHVVAADRVTRFHEMVGTLSPPCMTHLPPRPETWGGRSQRVHLGGGVVSVDAPASKVQLAEILPEEFMPAVVDMETYYLCEALCAREVPLAAIRSISDTLFDPVEERIREWMDESLRLSGRLILRDLMRRPGGIYQIARMARNALSASRALGTVLWPILEAYLSS
jgi:nucleoside phosphorylase